jgi:hypothetical protein
MSHTVVITALELIWALLVVAAWARQELERRPSRSRQRTQIFRRSWGALLRVRRRVIAVRLQMVVTEAASVADERAPQPAAVFEEQGPGDSATGPPAPDRLPQPLP